MNSLAKEYQVHSVPPAGPIRPGKDEGEAIQ